MARQITLKGVVVNYDLTYKKVKNINLRIKPDGSINVSANKRISIKVIEDFMTSKSSFILNAIKKYNNMDINLPKSFFEEDELKNLISNFCTKIYPYYKNRGIKFPVIKFRKMTSRWGSCHTVKGIVTFNTNLIYAPIECVEYVVYHEFTHFLQANHSQKFYDELSIVCPDWKDCGKKLKEIHIK